VQDDGEGEDGKSRGATTIKKINNGIVKTGSLNSLLIDIAVIHSHLLVAAE